MACGTSTGAGSNGPGGAVSSARASSASPPSLRRRRGERPARRVRAPQRRTACVPRRAPSPQARASGRVRSAPPGSPAHLACTPPGQRGRPHAGAATGAPVLHLRLPAQVLGHAALAGCKEPSASRVFAALCRRPCRPVRSRHRGKPQQASRRASRVAESARRWQGHHRSSPPYALRRLPPLSCPTPRSPPFTVGRCNVWVRLFTSSARLSGAKASLRVAV